MAPFQRPSLGSMAWASGVPTTLTMAHVMSASTLKGFSMGPHSGTQIRMLAIVDLYPLSKATLPLYPMNGLRARPRAPHTRMGTGPIK